MKVQWLRLCASTAGGEGSIPGLGPRSCKPHCVIKNNKQKNREKEKEKKKENKRGVGHPCL